jgi:D-alanyl-D-alanine carboxypeptidase
MRRNRRARGVWAVLAASAIAVITGCSPSPTVEHEPVPQIDAAFPSAIQDQFTTAVQTAMAATGSTGAIVEVRAPWAGVWRQALGTQTPKGGAVSPDLAFKAGPITRAMTCDVLYGMAHRGIVRIDDHLTRWLSGYPSAEGITLGDLCDSTSGLKSYAKEISDRWYVTPERVWKPKELVAYGMSTGFDGEPGTAYRDSDTGYVLLGLALERAGGKSAAELFDEYVFEPLGMESSALASGSRTGAGMLTGQRSANGEDGKIDCAAPVDITAVSGSAGFTAAGVFSTVDDLSDYVQALALGTRSFDTDARFADPLPTSTTAPTWLTARGGAVQAATLVGQAGAVPGYLTAAFADRETGMSVVVVLNNSRASGVNARDLAWELAAIVSKAPAAAGEKAPEGGRLPWEPQTYADKIVDAAICPLP